MILNRCIRKNVQTDGVDYNLEFRMYSPIGVNGCGWLIVDVWGQIQSISPQEGKMQFINMICLKKCLRQTSGTGGNSREYFEKIMQGKINKD